jgi:hypothetical protein
MLQALRHLAQGFVECARLRGQHIPPPDTLYDYALVVLYHQLFVLCARARGLIPPATISDIPPPPCQDATVNTGSLFEQPWCDSAPPIASMFHQEDFPFLTRHHVAPQHLRQARAVLTQPGRNPIDYRTLDGHDLGACYEHLLAYHLENDPQHDTMLKPVKTGHQRKAHGSFYTPTTIVHTIIEQTLGPLLHQAIAGMKGPHIGTDVDARVTAILTINVLDPAMGSGLFLTAAADYMARFLAHHVPEHYLPAHHQPHALAFWKQHVVQSCIYGVDINPLAVALCKFSLWLATDGAVPPHINHHLRTGNALFSFDWQTAFPDVFEVPEHNTAGFDAVVGNPPYVRQEGIVPMKPALQHTFPEVYHGNADLSAYFICQGLQLLRPGGRLSYLVSGTFRKLHSGARLRHLLATRSTLLEIVEYDGQRIFADAMAYPIMLAVQNKLPSEHDTCLVRKHITLEAPLKSMAVGATSSQPAKHPSPSPAQHNQQPERHPLPSGNGPWIFTSKATSHILEGWQGSRPLADMLSSPLCRGMTTGLNEAFIIDQATYDALVQADPTCTAILKPVLRGEDLHPWVYQQHHRHWIIFAHRGIDIHCYPAIKAHLLPFRTRLEPRPPGWDSTQPWPGRSGHSFQWYELQSAVRNHALFEQPRIHSTKISRFPSFCFAHEPMYATNTAYVLPVTDDDTGYYLLGMLNSRVCEYFCRQVFSPKASGYYEVQPACMARFPIPDAPTEERVYLAQLAREIHTQAHMRATLHLAVYQLLEHTLGTSASNVHRKHWTVGSMGRAAWWDRVQHIARQKLTPAAGNELEVWLHRQRSLHDQCTREIVRLETLLNERVYQLFHLELSQQRDIEQHTRYSYGDV